ncbi:MAG: hypothetical protein ACJ716_06925 [Marmoricola sp.]
MATQTSVAYTARDQAAAAENQRLIDAVFAELAERRPEGLTYRVSRSEDGLDFTHVAVVDGEENPLLALPTFQTFSSTVAERVVAPPVVRIGAVVADFS